MLLNLKKEQQKEKQEREFETPENIEDAMVECREILSHFWAW